jgi:hypothetical protein
MLGMSCTSINRSMKEAQPLVGFNKADFTFSDQVSGEATQTKILGIDFERLFMKKTGTAVSSAQIPVIGSLLQNQASGFALYELMQANQGYDVVVYPQYEVKKSRPILGLPLYTKTTVKVTARLGKLNK